MEASVPDEGEATRLDPGAAMVIGAGVLFLLSCLLPWYGRSLTAAATSPTLSLSGRVTATGPGWLLVLGLFLVTALVSVGRSRSAVVSSLACGALLVAGIAELVRRFPTITVPADLARGTAPLVHHRDTRLLGAALAVLAAGIAVVGVVVHAITCARAWRERAPGATG